MDYFSRGYTALRGDKGAPQSANDTIDKLCDRLLNGNSLEDRRAALLGLKGLSRDWKSVEFRSSLPPGPFSFERHRYAITSIYHRVRRR